MSVKLRLLLCALCVVLTFISPIPIVLMGKMVFQKDAQIVFSAFVGMVSGLVFASIILRLSRPIIVEWIER